MPGQHHSTRPGVDHEASKEGAPSDHFVQFYEDDEFLVESIAAYVGAGLATAEAAVVIATPGHLKALAGELKARGFDLGAVQNRGQYISMETEEALGRFIVNGVPDEALFFELVDQLIDRTPEGRRGLRVFGEMVAVLWSSGKGSAALELEKLWNKAGQRHSFSLFCAYPIHSFDGVGQGEDFARLCGEHTRVIPSEKYFAAASEDVRLRVVAELQQKASALEVEIGRRRRAEEEARRGQEYLQAVIDNTPECVKLVARDGTLLAMNGAGLSMLEAASPDELLGRSVYDVIAPEFREAFRAMHERVCAGHNERLEFEILGRKQGRRLVETHATPIVDPRTGELVQLALTRDITENRRAAEAFRQSEELNRSIIESTRDSIKILDLDGHLLFVHPGTRECPDATEGPRQPHHLWIDTWEAAHRTACVAAVAEAKAGRTGRFQGFCDGPEGGPKWWDVAVTPIVGRDGKIESLLALSREITEQKQVEGRLRLYKEIFGASKDAIAIISPDGAYLEQNAAHRNLLGYSDDELRSQTPAIHLGEASFAEIAAIIEREGRFRGEVVSRTKGGRDVDVELSAFAVRDEEGRVLCLVGLKRDITERKRAEKALARRIQEQAVLYQFTAELHRAVSPAQIYEAALNAIISALGCQRASILLFDEAGVMRFVAWRGLSPGYRQAVEGHSPWKPDDKDPQPICLEDLESADLTESLKTVVKREGIGALAFFPLIANGKVLGKFMAYYDAPHAFAADELDLSLIIARQLALGIERKRSEEATHRLAAIVESSDDAIISKDLNGVITSWNKGAQLLFGYTAEEAIGRPVTMLMPPDRVNEEPGILAKIAKGERIDHYETVRRRKDGTLIGISLTVSPIKDPRGNVIGASKIARDITDKTRAKEKLEHMVAERTAQLRDTVTELEAFSYSIAHDMRAPLRTMNSYSRFLEEDCAQFLPPQGKEYARRIAAGASRLDGLITDVLNYSKIARGELALDCVDVEKLTRDIIESYAELRDSRATILVQSPIPPVIGNPAALTQCLSNLLSNAVKFVAPGVIPQIRVWAEKKSDFVRLWVEDNGIGISTEGQKRIFRMFQRLNPAHEFEGTGIGLTIVRKAVERMGGRVGLESQPGVGSRFWIELKRAG